MSIGYVEMTDTVTGVTEVSMTFAPADENEMNILFQEGDASFEERVAEIMELRAKA